MSDRLPTASPLETAVHNFLEQERPMVVLGQSPAEYAIVPVQAINSLRHELSPGYIRPRAHVSIDPGIKGGQPCIAGTRLTAEWLADHVWRGRTCEDMQGDWDYLTREDMLVACWYVATYGPRSWRKRWSRWAEDAHPFLWDSTRQAACPWPPTIQDARAATEVTP